MSTALQGKVVATWRATHRVVRAHAPLHRVNVLVLAVALVMLALIDGELFTIVKGTLADVYLGVSVFVALTLAVFYALDSRYENGLAVLLAQHRRWEVPAASLLGALPGCGGAIIIVTQYVNGAMSFGGLVAVLISTMGDAAFLLLAREPQTAFLVYALSLTSGVLFGYLVNAIHGEGAFYREGDAPTTISHEHVPELPIFAKTLFLAMLLPGALLGLANAMQIDTDGWFGALAVHEPVTWIGFCGAFICLALWLSQPLDSWTARFQRCGRDHSVREMVVAETSFVSVWVVLGFLTFELLVYFTGLDLQSLFAGLGAASVLLATLIGFVPGCGPQIIVTTLYLNGIVPLSAQLANAISNDGDALFPALALAPRAALYATLYSAIPAVLMGLGAVALGY